MPLHQLHTPENLAMIEAGQPCPAEYLGEAVPACQMLDLPHARLGVAAHHCAAINQLVPLHGSRCVANMSVSLIALDWLLTGSRRYVVGDCTEVPENGSAKVLTRLVGRICTVHHAECSDLAFSVIMTVSSQIITIGRRS